MQETTYQIPGLPASAAVLSDIHEQIHPGILPSLRARRPSLILVPGDFILGKPSGTGLRMEGSPILPFFVSLTELAPVYVSLGNHEWVLEEEDIVLIRETGVHLLDNAFAFDQGICLGGLTSGPVMVRRRYPDLKGDPDPLFPGRQSSPPRKLGPDLGWLSDFEKAPGFRILLNHHPEYYKRHLENRKIDLVVSGHAHGGQWRFYWPPDHAWRGVFSPGQGLFPRYTSGLVDGRLVISRGLTNTARPIPRFFNPTEIVYLERP